MVPYKNIIYQKEQSLAILTFNRPEVRNALSFATIDEALDAVKAADADPEIRVLIVTGYGDKAFISGADINELKERDTFTEMEERSGRRRVLTRLLETMSKPSIAAINGFATGGGLEVAMACTIRIASDNAKMGLPEINLGIMPGNGGTQRLPRIVSKGYAMEMVLTGDLIDAQQAQQIGLVNYVVPQSELMGKAKEIAAKIAAKSPLAVMVAKDAINMGINMGLSEALEYEARAFAILCGSEDKKEGVGAFLEKRKPTFKGR